MNNEKEITNHDILYAINSFASSTEELFLSIEERLSGVDGRLDVATERLTGLEQLVNTQIATKHYLDDKLADLRGDILTIIRKEDSRVRS